MSAFHYPNTLTAKPLLLGTALFSVMLTSTHVLANQASSTTHPLQVLGECRALSVKSKSANTDCKQTGNKARVHSSTITMKQAVQAALQRHPQSKVAKARRKVGDSYQKHANALFKEDPTYEISYLSDELNADRGLREYEANVGLPLWMPGQKGARKKLADSIYSRVDAEQELLKWQVAGEVLQRAWDLKIASMEVTQAKIQQTSARALEQDIRRRVDAGELARKDLVLAQQSTLEAQSTLQQAQANTQNVRIAWQSYTGFSKLPKDLGQFARKQPVNQGTHPQTKAHEAKSQLARANRDDVRMQRKQNPTLTLYAKRDRGLVTDDFDNSLGVGISVPFGSRASSASELADASATVVELDAEQAQQERMLNLEIQQVKLKVQTAVQALQLAKQQNQLAQKRLKLATRAFELGESDLFQLIRAREQAASMSRTLKRSQLELNRSQSMLNHLLGTMP